METLFPAPAPVLAAIAGNTARFPVRRIYCVGRNYAAHAREMGGDDREPPFFFTKFADTLVIADEGETATIPYPPQTADFHHEGELVVALGRGGTDIAPEAALDHVYGYACGLDMTRRDLQAAARAAGKPWDMAKNVTGAAVLGPILPTNAAMTAGAITLAVNGATRQQGDLADLIWSCAEVIAHLSRFDTLAAGDLIYTGTPAGVGAVVPGDTLALTIDGLPPLHARIGAA